jgi:cytochrome c oxidase subunit 4
MIEAEYTPLPVSPKSEHDEENKKYHTFVNLALILAAITGIELVLVYLPLNTIFITVVLITLSLFKFVAVIAWFMHLIYDQLLLTLVFGAGLAIAAGTVVALMFLMSPSHVDFDAITAF